MQMCGAQGVGHLDENIKGLIYGQAALSTDQLAERFTAQQIHNIVRKLPAYCSHIVDAHDTRVVDFGQGLSLCPKTCPVLFA